MSWKDLRALTKLQNQACRLVNEKRNKMEPHRVTMYISRITQDPGITVEILKQIIKHLEAL